MGVLFIIVVIYVTFIFISSPFLFVYGDDRVIRSRGQMLIQVMLRMLRRRS